MKSKKRTLTQRLSKYILPGLITVLLGAVIVLAYLLAHVNYKVNQLAPSTISRLIVDAVEQFGRDLNADPKTGVVYFYEARLTLPPVPDTGPALRYSYTKAAEGQPLEIKIIDRSTLGISRAQVLAAQSHEAVFNNVPKLQSCARGYLLTTEKITTDGLTEVFTKQLQDGRTIYAYTEQMCLENKDIILPYIQQIQSY